jgi:elongation of very long chain fatty acids protein 4
MDAIVKSFSSALEEFPERINNGSILPAQFGPEFMNHGFLDYTNFTAIFYANVVYFVLVFVSYRVLKSKEMNGAMPMNLKPILRVYNLVCVVLAGLVVVEIVRYKYETSGSYVCNDLSHVSAEAKRRFFRAMWYYYAQKYFEMLDTIFFIFRFSWRQVSFLHVYHHSSITIVTALFITYDSSGDIYLPAMMNSFIHVLMYSHYFLSSFQSLKRHVWWRPYLTSLQLLQFAICWVQPILALRGNCGFPKFLAVLMICYQTSMLFLFTAFAKKRYGKNATLTNETKLAGKAKGGE